MCLIGGLKTQKMLASTKIRQGRASSYIRTILHGELLFLYLLQNRENFTIQVIDQFAIDHLRYFPILSIQLHPSIRPPIAGSVASRTAEAIDFLFLFGAGNIGSNPNGCIFTQRIAPIQTNPVLCPVWMLYVNTSIYKFNIQTYKILSQWSKNI